MCACWWSDQKRSFEEMIFEERVESSKRADHRIGGGGGAGSPVKQKQKALQILQE